MGSILSLHLKLVGGGVRDDTEEKFRVSLLYLKCIKSMQLFGGMKCCHVGLRVPTWITNRLYTIAAPVQRYRVSQKNVPMSQNLFFGTPGNFYVNLEC